MIFHTKVSNFILDFSIAPESNKFFDNSREKAEIQIGYVGATDSKGTVIDSPDYPKNKAKIIRQIN